MTVTVTQIIPIQQNDAANITKHLFFRTTEFLFVFSDAVGAATVTAIDSVCANDGLVCMCGGLVVISTARECCAATAIFLFFLIRLVLFVFFEAVAVAVGAAVIGAPTTATCDSMFDRLVFIWYFLRRTDVDCGFNS